MSNENDELPVVAFRYQAQGSTGWSVVTEYDHDLLCDANGRQRADLTIESLVRRSDAQRIKDERDEALEVLRELMLWIENWGCAFHDDPEWPETDAKVRALLTKRGAA